MSYSEDSSGKQPSRIKTYTEKGWNYHVQLLEDQSSSAQRAWRKQINKLSNLLADSTTVELLKTERAFLETRMEILRAAFRKYRPTVGTRSKFDFAHIWLIDNP